MFNHRTASTAALDERLAALHESNESWLDGTIESVDRRIAAVQLVHNDLRGRVAHGSEDLVGVLTSIESSLTELRGLRTAILNAPAAEPIPARRASVDEYRSLPGFARREIEARSRSFLGENSNVATDAAELAIRSGYEGRRLAENMPMTPGERELTIEAFVDAVQRRAQALPVSKPRVASAPNTEWSDDLLFM